MVERHEMKGEEMKERGKIQIHQARKKNSTHQNF
jgi:hypothetical protein